MLLFYIKWSAFLSNFFFDNMLPQLIFAYFQRYVSLSLPVLYTFSLKHIFGSAELIWKTFSSSFEEQTEVTWKDYLTSGNKEIKESSGTLIVSLPSPNHKLVVVQICKARKIKKKLQSLAFLIVLQLDTFGNFDFWFQPQSIRNTFYLFAKCACRKK